MVANFPLSKYFFTFLKITLDWNFGGEDRSNDWTKKELYVFHEISMIKNVSRDDF